MSNVVYSCSGCGIRLHNERVTVDHINNINRERDTLNVPKAKTIKVEPKPPKQDGEIKSFFKRIFYVSRSR